MKKSFVIFIIFLALLALYLQYTDRPKKEGVSPCNANLVLQDKRCTPGDILTTDSKVICVKGYTATVRKVSDSLRKQVFAEYGIDWAKHSAYEVDHLISLELGGSNSISNLWPEAYDITNGARVKDQVENYLHAQICSGKITIQKAQSIISSDWTKAIPKNIGAYTPSDTDN